MNPYDPLYDEDAAIARAYLDNLDAAPDQRLAALDAANAVDLGGKYAIPVDATQQPGPPPSMSDVPVNMGTPEDQLAAQRAVARDMAVQQSIPEPGPPPEGIAAQPVAYEGGAVQPQQVEERGPTGLDRYVFAPLFRGPTPGRVVPEHEQKLGYSVQRQAPVDRTRFEESVSASAEKAEEAGRMGRFAAEDEADAAQRRKIEEAAQLGEFQMKREEMAQQLEQRESDYQQLVAESKVDPDVFWSRRDTGEKIMAAIGGLLMGLGGNADKFIQMIEGEREHAQEERDRETSAARERLMDFRDRTYTPQAADGFENALKARIVAEDMRMMAAESQSVESQMRGEEEAAKLEQYAAEQEMAAKRAEAGAIAEKVAVVPRQVVGGSRGGTIEDAKKRYLGAGGSLEVWQDKVLPRIQRGELSLGDLTPDAMSGLSGEARVNFIKDARTRKLRLPDGRPVYVSDQADKKDILNTVNAANFIKGNFAKLERLLANPQLSTSPALRSEYNAIVASNEGNFKNLEALGALSKDDRELIKPLTGKEGQEITTLSRGVLGALKGAKAHVGQRERDAMRQIYVDPDAETPLVTDTEQGLGIEVD